MIYYLRTYFVGASPSIVFSRQTCDTVGGFLLLWFRLYKLNPSHDYFCFSHVFFLAKIFKSSNSCSVILIFSCLFLGFSILGLPTVFPMEYLAFYFGVLVNYITVYPIMSTPKSNFFAYSILFSMISMIQWKYQIFTKTPLIIACLLY